MVEWTKEQAEIIDKMIRESETIGYAMGVDDTLKEIIQEFEEFLRKIKSKFIRKD